MAITDPTVMTPLCGQFRNIGPAPDKIVFIPHCGTERFALDWARIASHSGVMHLSPAQSSVDVIREIASSSRVITEPLHGATIADAFRIPWTAIAISPDFNVFKWMDWARSMELDIEVAPSLRAAKSIFGAAGAAKFHLGQVKNVGRIWNRSGTNKISPRSRQNELQSLSLAQEEKDIARNIVDKFSIVVESMISRDILNAKKRTPHLSTSRVLAERQNSISERLQEIKRLYSYVADPPTR
jgi:succinoglycan biosynthesis protein ExoV